MKVGFILECSIKGPDAEIYPYVALRLCPKLEIVKPETLGNKQVLMSEAPLVAQTLIEDGCDYVFIIWDRMPKWGGTGRCSDHIEILEQGLAQLGVDRNRIFLCCISDMMESWMIVNGQPITAYFQSFTTKPLQYFGDNKTAALQADPKNRIKKYNGRYNDYVDNFRIVKLMNDFDMPARWNDSFREFKEYIESICPK